MQRPSPPIASAALLLAAALLAAGLPLARAALDRAASTGSSETGYLLYRRTGLCAAARPDADKVPGVPAAKVRHSFRPALGADAVTPPGLGQSLRANGD